MMVGLYPGPLVHELFRFALVNTLVALENPLVVFVMWALELFFWHESSQLVTFFCWLCLYQKESIPKMVNS